MLEGVPEFDSFKAKIKTKVVPITNKIPIFNQKCLQEHSEGVLPLKKVRSSDSLNQQKLT